MISRYIGQHPAIGIRPVIDARRGALKVRESLEAQTMGMAERAAALLRENLRYADGDAEALERIDQLGDRQAAALMTAAELLLTGESRAAQGRIPLGYGLGEYEASIERFSIVGSGDTGTLTNYRLRK